MTCQPTASHYINGAFAEDDSGAALDTHYPYDGRVLARLHSATPVLIERALAAAEAAQPAWAALKPVERARILQRAAAIIRERGADLARLEALDTGKPIQETEVADWPSGADALEYFAGLAPAVTGETIPLGPDFAYTRREALGVCVGIGAWNYPSQIACWKAAPALVMGNTMVFKPSEITPLGALKLAEIFTEAGMPPGVFNVVQGFGDVGAALIGDARVAKVSLTGSVPTGRKVYQAAAAGLKHVTLELGGKSPLIIFDDARLEDAIGAAMLGNFYSSGQICSNGTRVFVQRGIYERFLTRLAARTAAIKSGDPLDPDTQFGPIITPAQLEKISGFIARCEARLICGGTVTPPFVAPTVYADVTDDMEIAREEIFGPVMAVLPFDDEDEVIARAGSLPYGLAAGVFTENLSRAHRVIGALKAGTCWINTYNLTPVEMPFGPYGDSGLGRENGHAALHYYSQVKSVYVGMEAVDAPY